MRALRSKHRQRHKLPNQQLRVLRYPKRLVIFPWEGRHRGRNWSLVRRWDYDILHAHPAADPSLGVLAASGIKLLLKLMCANQWRMPPNTPILTFRTLASLEGECVPVFTVQAVLRALIGE